MGGGDLGLWVVDAGDSESIVLDVDEVVDDSEGRHFCGRFVEIV